MNFNIRKTVINDNGKIIFFGLHHFLNDIAKGDCCFICGAKPNSKEFNDEHIIPNWILKRYKLYNELITLTNRTRIKYGNYKVPCCKECNSELGDIYELPISILLNKTYSEIVQVLKKDPKIVHLLFRWLCLIYLKTHLKDKSLFSERDKRIHSGFLAEDYFWEDMHHIHCIARSHYTNALIDSNVYGTIFILPVITNKKTGEFDYIDSHSGKGIMIQLGEFSIISVLNDACAGYSFYKEKIQKISGSLTPFQVREIVANLNFINLSLKKSPEFFSFFTENGDYQIKVRIPKKVKLLAEDERFVTPGKFLRYYVEEMIGDIDNKEQILNEIELGKRAYLFDENGIFINHNK